LILASLFQSRQEILGRLPCRRRVVQSMLLHDTSSDKVMSHLNGIWFVEGFRSYLSSGAMIRL
jgi:hypothetical protein